MDEVLIRFKHGDLGRLRENLLADLDNEYFAMLLCQTQTVDGTFILKVLETRYPRPGECWNQSRMSISPTRDFVHRILVEAQNRLDVDTVLDVHTHPFTDAGWFSGTDDGDEYDFATFLENQIGGIGYGSIVFSRQGYRARLWKLEEGKPVSCRAVLKTQTAVEAIGEGASGDNQSQIKTIDTAALQSRTALALGLDTLRRMTTGQFIVLAGVGGLGSIMAEHLVHQGFNHIGLIDPDRLELSNLNRFVGAGHTDAMENRSKVKVVAKHLRHINPGVRVQALAEDVDSPEAVAMMAKADWILLSTDNYASRYAVQRTALQYGVPLISAGVNITVKRNGSTQRLIDRSGEVIVARSGDGFCLNCLGRINLAEVAAESHPDPQVREGTVARGYVQGMTVKEPAVKTLNAMIGSLAVECLINQYQADAVHEPILVYESHAGACLYPDRESLENRQQNCPHCQG